MARAARCGVLAVTAAVAAIAMAQAETARATGEPPPQGPSRTVWDRVYTEQQAQRGRTEYMQACASCHGEDLRGRSTAPSLVEESFAFLWNDRSLGELLERTQTLMPSDRPNSLSSQSYRDIVAFVLEANKIPPGDQELDADAQALLQVFITAPPK